MNMTTLLLLNILMAVLLPVAKLLGLIGWSWVWVLAPLWGGAIVWLGLLAMVIYALNKMGK